ncbi:MAG: gamma-glutamylcyclotransferase [Rhodanobacter sp.]
MTADTRHANRRRTLHADDAQVWVFGYGSLIYKVDFPYIERRRACIRHWQRRLWQGSHDHRGTPEAPGRVVTLIREPEAVCTGMAYLITPAAFAQLDEREKNGYLRFSTGLELGNGEQSPGLVYIAPAGNAAFLGPASECEIARHVAACCGASGPNRDYVLKLATALRKLGTDDPHVFTVERHLLSLIGSGGCAHGH